MKRSGLTFVFALLFPFTTYGADLNAGFVTGLWYGNETLVASESTRIYVALRNNTDHDLTGTVRFTDNDVRIGITSISALPGRIVEAWVDWTPTYGDHVIRASLTDVRVHGIGETPEEGQIEDTIAEDTIFVDRDTDKDGVVNEQDTDDDNDTVTDIDETTNGTDPLIPNPVEESGGNDAEENKKDEDQTRNRGNSNDEDEGGEVKGASVDALLGLERYVENGAAHTVVQSVTETMEETKSRLDEYRSKRNDAIKEYFRSDGTEDTTTGNGDDAGTITRSNIVPEETFFESVIRGGKALLASIYTFILWVTSHVLSHPAILELFLLLLIIYIVYRLARRMGRRRTN